MFNGDFDLPQHLFAHFADRRTEGGNGGRGVEIKDAQKILMGKVFFRLQPAARHEGVCDTDGGGAAKLHTDVKLIIFLQKAIVNDVEDVVAMLVPIFIGKLARDIFQLGGNIIRAAAAIAALQRSRYRILMLWAVLP